MYLRHTHFLLLLCLLFAGGSQRVMAQHISYVTTAQPFPFTGSLYTNEVKRVYQDTQGYIWFATTSGLARWDGYRLQTLRSDWMHPTLLTDNNLGNMADGSGWMWIGSDRGMNCYRQSNGQIVRPADSLLHSNFINDVKPDGQGGVWTATGRRLFHWDGNEMLITETLNPFEGLCDEVDIYTLYVDHQQRLWVSCEGGTLLVVEQAGHSWKVRRLPPLPVAASLTFFYEDDEGRYWQGTWGQGLWQLLWTNDTDHAVWQQQTLGRAQSSAEDLCTFSMVQGGGLLWLLTYERLHALRYAEGQLLDIDISDVIPTNKMFTDMIRDREGNLWLSAYDDGYIVRFNAQGMRNHSLPSLSRLLQHDANLKGVVADDHYVWLNQDRFGILLLDTQTGDIAHSEQGTWEEATKMARSCDAHSIWVAKRMSSTVFQLTHNGLTVSETWRTNLNDVSPDAGDITDLYETADRHLWLLTNNNRLLAQRTTDHTWLTMPDTLQYTAMTPLPGDRSIVAATASRLVTCTASQHGIECKPFDIQLPLATDEKVQLMTGSDDGHLWLVTSLGRILQANLKEQTCEQPELADWLRSEEVQDLRCHASVLWVMTDKRLVAYDRQHGTTQTYRAGQEDICVQRFLLYALDIDNEGNVLAGGYGGFIRIGSGRETDAADVEYLPIATDILLEGHSLLFENTEQNDNTFRHITLPCDARDITVLLSRLCYGSENQVAVQYKLEGVDPEWRSVDAQNPSAFYNRLPRGTHKLTVRMQQADGTWSEPVEILTFVRLPHWYETWWAFTAYLLIAAVLVLLLIKYIRTRQARQVHSEVTQAKMTVLASSHAFTDQLIDIVHQHLDDSSFGVEELASALNTSKSTLHRRIKSEIDMTPLEIINSIRLKEAAAMLLADKSRTVAEVAYDVGFTSPKYFTQCFKAEFGATPTEYRKRAAAK